MTGMLRASIICVGALTVMATASTAPAQLVSVPPSAERGAILAERFCASCHVVGRQSSGATVKADVPTFAAIAKRPGLTAEQVAGAIVMPHPPMPQVQLTRDEIADLATYILSLSKS